MSRLRASLLPTISVLALVLGACSGEEDSSGLATLQDTAPVAETVPESEVVEAAGVVAAPPEATVAPPEAGETAAAETTGTTAVEATGTTATETTGTTTVATAAATTTSAADEDVTDGSPATATTQPTPPESSLDAGEEDLTDEERLLRFADCMREHGVDFPDPIVEADGTVQFGFRPGAGGGGRLQELGRDPDLPAARQACEDLLEGLSFGPGSGNFDTTELQDTLLEFARCMRANGVDMGDPDLSNFGPGGEDDGPGGGPFGGAVDFRDPDVVAALEVCQEEVNIGRFAGGGRGGNS